MMSCMSLPGIDFANIRPYGQPPSRAAAFEELSSILIEQGVVEWPEGVSFERFGNPDGGREGQGVLPNGDVWAWQTKYLFTFNASAVQQITRSVRRALEAERRLKRYYVILPMNLPSGDTAPAAQGGKVGKSAHTRWTEAVQEWEKAANGVKFILVNEHMLLTALTEPRHAGRVRYWFDAHILSPQWQQDHLDEAIAKAGRRYTPEIHVEVAAARALDAVGRTDAYIKEWKYALAWFRRSHPRQWPVDSRGDALDDAVGRCCSALDVADEALERMIAALGSAGKLPEAEKSLCVALESLRIVNDLLSSGVRSSAVDELLRNIRGRSSEIERGLHLAASEPSRAAAKRLLLLTGHAGSGKTHLLCDIAQRRTENGAPTILLFGQDFDGRALLEQIGKLSRLGETNDALSVLNAASEAAGCIGLLIIDALNESVEPNRWPDTVRQLAKMCARHPHLALVLSCRTEFVEEVVGDQSLPHVKHTGFAEATDRAVLRFTQVYGLEPSTFASLNPEFGNPLYLKLACEALHTLGEGAFRLGVAGLTTITGAFLEAVHRRLSEPGRCNFDPHQQHVRKCVDKIAELGPDPWPREDVQAITDAQLPGRDWSNSLLRHMIAEGVLLELPGSRLRFGYQRLGDIARASIIADRGPEGVRDWLNGLGDDDVWAERGVLDALAIILPERQGTEITELEDDPDSDLSGTLLCSFIDSLPLRDPSSVTPEVVNLATSALVLDGSARTYWPALLSMACIPGHPLNAKFLHTYLSGLKLSDRNASWSTLVVGSPMWDDEEIQAIRRMIDWAWTEDPTTRTRVPEDIAELAILTLGWLLTMASQTIHEYATKGLVSLGERAPAAFTRAIIRFKGVNDPCITERLTAAACGIVLRHCTDDTAGQIADALADLLEDDWPPNLLTGDYARQVFAEAGTRGWRITDHYDIGLQAGVPFEPYQYLEQVISRDFDPTVLVRVRDPRSSETAWFSPGEVDFEEGSAAEGSGVLDGVPDPLDLIAVRDPHGVHQLVLASRRRWDQLIPPKDTDGRIPRLWAWMHITTYLASPTRRTGLMNWTEGRGWLGRPVPLEPDVPSGLLGAYPDDPHWAYVRRTMEIGGLCQGGQPVAGFSPAAVWYAEPGGTKPEASAAWDNAVDGATSGWLPSLDLYEMLGLRRGVDFVWDDDTTTAVYSPSAGLYSPATLVMRRNLMPRLIDAKQTLFWTVLIGKQPYNSRPHGDSRWVNACATYLFDGDKVRLVKAEAAHLTANNEVEYNLEWTPRQTDH
jgi:hypothetical protein